MDSNHNTNGSSQNIKCFVRCKPLNEKELSLDAGVIKINENSKTIYIDNRVDSKQTENKPYTFDHVFGTNTNQHDIFDTVATPVLKSFLEGFNSTIFCYGQTGSGKTHTILGPLDSLYTDKSHNHGIIPRIFQHIFETFAANLDKTFDKLESDPEQTNEEESCKKIYVNENNFQTVNFALKCSCMEIYQENIIDLLSSSEDNSKLIIREDPKKGMYIDGITECSIDSVKTGKELLMIGLKNRHVAATNMNSESSRSHLIFTIYMNTSYFLPDGTILTRNPRLHLIDLAGSERQKSTMAIGGRLREAAMINKSLSTLGNVINALVEIGDSKNKHVPFRDSKLTYFLKDSLGGNSKTTIVANISQSIINMNETISTLKFVQRAKMIKNKAVISESVNDTVKNLQIEIKRLKEEITVLNSKIKVESKHRRSISSDNVDEAYPIKKQILAEELTNFNENSSRLIEESQCKPEKLNQNMLTNLNISELIAKIENLLKFENKTIEILNSMLCYKKSHYEDGISAEKILIFNELPINRDLESPLLSTSDFNLQLLENSNKEIQYFFEEYFKLRPRPLSEFKLTHSVEVENMRLLIEALKEKDENNLKVIDELNNEIFLLKMELTYQMKPSLTNESYENSSCTVSEFHSETPQKNIQENSSTDFGNEFVTPSDREKFEKDLTQNKSLLLTSKENNFQLREFFSAAKSSIERNKFSSSGVEYRICNCNSDKNIFSSKPELMYIKKLEEDLQRIVEEKNNQINSQNEKIKEVTNMRENLENKNLSIEIQLRELKEENENYVITILELKKCIEKLELENSNHFQKFRKLEESVKNNFDFNVIERSEIEKIIENNEQNLKEIQDLYHSEINFNFENYKSFYHEINRLKVEEKLKKIHIEFLSKESEKILNERKEIESHLIFMCEENQSLKSENDKLILEKLNLQNILEINLQEISDISFTITKNNYLVEEINNNYISLVDSLGKNLITYDLIKKLKGIEKIFEKSLLDINSKLEKSETVLNSMKEKILKLKLKFKQNPLNSSSEKSKNKPLNIKDVDKLSLDDENQKIRLLMKFKNENYNLKMTMIELKKQNEILQEENSKNSKLQNSLLKSFSKEKIEKYNIESDIFSKIFKEHDELIKQTLNLEPYLKLDEKYFLSQKRNDVFNLKEFEEENKFIKCSQILKNVEESLELMRFHTQNKLKKEKIINNIQCSSDKENISNNILIDDEKNYLQEKFKNNNQNQVGDNFVFNTRNSTPIRQNEKKNNNLINKLNKKTDVDKIASNVEKIRDMFAPENFENNLIKTQHIMKK